MHNLVQVFLTKTWSRREDRQILKNLILGESSTSLGRLSQWMTVLIVKKNCKFISNLHLTRSNLYPLFHIFSKLLPEKKKSPFSFWSHPISSGAWWYRFPWDLFSQGWKNPVLWAFPHIAGFPALWSSLWPFCGLSAYPHRFYGRDQNWAWYFTYDLTSTEENNDISLPLLLHPSILLIFFATATAHYLLILNLKPIGAPRSLSAELLCNWVDPTLWYNFGMFCWIWGSC